MGRLQHSIAMGGVQRVGLVHPFVSSGSGWCILLSPIVRSTLLMRVLHSQMVNMSRMMKLGTAEGEGGEDGLGEEGLQSCRGRGGRERRPLGEGV